MSVFVGHKQNLFVFYGNIFESITFLFSKLKNGKIYLSKINFIINEYLKYFGNEENFL